MAEPGESFDEFGYELANGYGLTEQDATQGALFAGDYSQPAAPDGEPVFGQERDGRRQPPSRR